MTTKYDLLLGKLLKDIKESGVRTFEKKYLETWVQDGMDFVEEMENSHKEILESLETKKRYEDSNQIIH